MEQIVQQTIYVYFVHALGKRDDCTLYFVKGKQAQRSFRYTNFVDNVLLNDNGKTSLGIRRQTISYHTVDVSSLYLKGENSVNGAEK